MVPAIFSGSASFGHDRRKISMARFFDSFRRLRRLAAVRPDLGPFFLLAAGIYVIEVCVLLGATQIHTVNWAIFFFVMISFTVNSTHSLLGPAAAMDIGGRKMAGFVSGVIDSFQYFGAAVAIKMLGYILDRYGWGFYFYYMIPFGIIGGCLMYSIAHPRRSQKKPG